MMLANFMLTYYISMEYLRIDSFNNLRHRNTYVNIYTRVLTCL